MLIKLIEIFKQPGDRMRLDEVYVSGDAVTSIRSDNQMLSEAVELGISPDASFSRVTINEGGMARTITVIGSPVEIKNKLGIKNLLKG
jgi:hypothetical protein|tara:strand:- start:371 stop:634 length:264 start_codon:yes stop_codon:yes gene_type:complete